MEERRRRSRQELLDEAGAEDLGAYLRSAYAAGASLDLLAHRTQLGRAQLRQAVLDAGIVIRKSGANTAEGKRSRAHAADAVAARRVGAADVRAWLGEHTALGATVAELACAVGWERAVGPLAAGIEHRGQRFPVRN